MLKRLDSLPSAFPSDDPYIIRIASEMSLCRRYGSPGECFVQDEGALLLCGVGVIVLYAGPEADFDELSSFIGFNRGSRVLSDHDTVLRLGISAANTGTVMKRQGAFRISDEISFPENTDDFRQIYNLVFPSADFDTFFVDLMRRINSGNAVTGVIKCDGEIVSTASLLYRYRGGSVLCGVATKPEWRGKGLAGMLTDGLSDKNTYLMCDDSLVDYYFRHGFEPCGQWCEATV